MHFVVLYVNKMHEDSKSTRLIAALGDIYIAWNSYPGACDLVHGVLILAHVI